MSWRNLALAVAAAAQLTCHQAILTAPPGSTLTLFANPPFIPANGGVSIISALVIEPAGTPVADGTVIQCFTTLGRVDEQSKTNDGVARFNLVSDSRSGTATVICVSGAPAETGPAPSPSPTIAPTPGGSGTGSVQVVIGSVRPERVQVTADPNPIQTDGPRESVISAFVFDEFGNAVANVPVIFTIEPEPVPGPAPSPSPSPSPSAPPSGSTNTERLEGEGQPIFTDNNGRAQDVLRTQYPLSSPSKQVTVVATVPTGEFGEVVVTIN